MGYSGHRSSRSGVRSSPILLTSGPRPRSSLNVPAWGPLQPLCSDSRSRSAARPAQQPPLRDLRLLPAAGAPRPSTSVPRPGSLDRGAIPQPLILPLPQQVGRGLPRQPPTPCLSPRWWNSRASGTGGSLRGALGPRPETAAPSGAPSARRVAQGCC